MSKQEQLEEILSAMDLMKNNPAVFELLQKQADELSKEIDLEKSESESLNKIASLRKDLELKKIEFFKLQKTNNERKNVAHDNFLTYVSKLDSNLKVVEKEYISIQKEIHSLLSDRNESEDSLSSIEDMIQSFIDSSPELNTKVKNINQIFNEIFSSIKNRG